MPRRAVTASDCIENYRLTEDEKNFLNNKSSEYLKGGMSVRDAMKQAALDMKHENLRELNNMYARMGLEGYTERSATEAPKIKSSPKVSVQMPAQKTTTETKGGVTVIKPEPPPKPKPRGRVNPDILQLMNQYKISMSAAQELDELIKQKLPKQEFIDKAREIITRGRGLGTSEGDQLQNIKSEGDESIKSATTGIELQKRVEYDGPLNRSIDDAAGNLKSGGEVVWSGVIGQQRVDGGEAGAVDDTKTKRAGDFGRGLFNDSGSSKKVTGEESLYEILTGEGYTEQQRGIAAAYIAAQRLLDNKDTDFVGRLFARTANTDAGKVRVRIFSDSSPNAHVLSANQNGTIGINAAKLGKRLTEFMENGGGEQSFLTWMEAALNEEVVHLATFKVSTTEELEQVAEEMTNEERMAVSDLYGKDPDSMSKFELGAEYVRMVMQEKVLGTSTEMFKPTVKSKEKKNLFSKILAFIRDTFKNTGNRKATQIVKRLRDFIDGKEQKQRTEKPAVSVFERPEKDSPVYKVQYRDNFLFVQARMDGSGLGYYAVVKDKRGNWVTNEGLPFGSLLGYNPEGAMNRITQVYGKESGTSGQTESKRDIEKRISQLWNEERNSEKELNDAMREYRKENPNTSINDAINAGNENIKQLYEKNRSIFKERMALVDKAMNMKDDLGPSVSQIQNDILATESKIEDLQNEIEAEKSNLKEEVDRIRGEIEKVRNSNLSKDEKEEQIDDLKYQIEEARDEYDSLVESYKDDIALEKADLKKYKKQLDKATGKGRESGASMDDAMDDMLGKMWDDSNPQSSAKEVADKIRNQEISYAEAIQNMSDEFIDELSKELGWIKSKGKSFSPDMDSFREQVRRYRDLGMSKEDVMQDFSKRKKITKKEQDIIDELYYEHEDDRKAAEEFQEAVKDILSGEKPKSVLRKLSASKVKELVKAMGDALTYRVVSNKELADIADYIVDTIDMDNMFEYIDAMNNTNLADVKQVLRAKLILKLQEQEGTQKLSQRLVEDMANEATAMGRQTQSLKMAYELLGAYGSPQMKTAFAAKFVEAVNQQAEKRVKSLMEAGKVKDEEIDRLNEKIHKMAQGQGFVEKIKNLVDKLCNIRSKK